jgi:peptidoglycan/LPS O-acetylase OafA/YrhL
VVLYVYATVAIAFLFRETRHSKIDAEVGELSYPVYLAHYPLIELYNVVFDPAPTLTQAAVRSFAGLSSSRSIPFAIGVSGR